MSYETVNLGTSRKNHTIQSCGSGVSFLTTSYKLAGVENTLNKWIEGKPITLENTLKSYAINGIIGGVSGGLKSAYEGKNFWTGEYHKIYYGKGCCYQVFNEGWKYKNPKGAFSLATGFRVGKNKVLHFALLGYKINMNPSWVRNSQVWPNYWRNSPILFPGMIWFTEH